MEGLGKAIIGGVIAVGGITYATNIGGGSFDGHPNNIHGGNGIVNDNSTGGSIQLTDPRCTNGNFRGGQGMDPQTLSDIQKMMEQACARWQAQMDQRDRNGNTGPVPTIEIKPPDNSLEGS